MCLGAIYWARLKALYFAAGKEDAAHAGFDDSFIYRELSKPYQQRGITIIQLLRNEALSVLEEWRNREDTIQY
jgi:guanine deaminase